ncbi:hypothetical protein, partial [Escherichia coli]|uniref:hypothetical protein n=1 Tax=Escherichia coli TaxID=562 RepID=UPI0032DBDFC0
PNPSCINILENPCALFENTLDTCVNDSPCINVSITHDYDCFKFREDDSMKNFDVLTYDYKDSLLFKHEYDCFNFLEDESFILGESELMSEGDDASFYSCESESNFWEDERREGEEGMVGNNGSFTFDLMEKVEWRELTTLEIEEGSEEYG